MRRRLSVALAALTTLSVLLGLRLPANAYFLMGCTAPNQVNNATCPWRNPDMIYVGAYGQGVPPYLMDATGQALTGWNSVTSFQFAWEDRNDTSAQIIIVPYWQNANKWYNGNWEGLGWCDQTDSSGRWCVKGEVDLNLDNSTNAWLFKTSDATYRNRQTWAIAQETGHAIGLDHSCANGWQLMSGYNTTHNCGAVPYCGMPNNGACPVHPQSDDIKGVNALYPQGNSNGSHGCAGTAPPVNPNSLPVSVPSSLPTTPPLPAAPPLPTALPSVQPAAASGADVPVPDWVPTTPTPLPMPTTPTPPPGVSTDPTSNVVYQNGVGEVQNTEQDPLEPARVGEAEAYNQVAKANGLYPGGQEVRVAPVGTGNLPAVGAADINYDMTIPTVANRPC